MRGARTRCRTEEKEIGICDVSQGFLRGTSHNHMRLVDVVQVKDCWERLTEERPASRPAAVFCRWT